MSEKERIAPISVSNLVNLSNLERVFDDIFEKISVMNKRMDKLETNLSQSVSLTRYLSLENEYKSNINLFESRIKYLEENISEMKPICQQSSYNCEGIAKINDKIKALVTNEEFEASVNDIEMTISDKIEQISSTKCSNQTAQNLKDSTKTICSQISAIESMLHCKVDKSQIPLIQSCSKQLENLEIFRDEMSEKTNIFSEQISEITNNLNAKIDTEIFEQSQMEMNKSVTSKVDMTFLNEEVIKRLNTLLPDLLVLLKEHKQISITKCFDEIQTLKNECLKEVLDRLNINKNNIDSILKSLYNIPSLQQIEMKADMQFCKDLNNQSKEFCKHNCDELQNNITDINKEITKLQIISNSLNEKTKVALKFVDWYSSVQLET